MFNPLVYKLFNNDLKHLNKNQLTIHWKTIGIKENRIFNISTFFQKYSDFDLNVYIKNNPDISKYDELIIMSHYHHNFNYNKNLKNKIIINYKNHNELNIINEYLNKYYKFKYKLCIILFNLNKELINSLENINNSQYNIYLINNNSKNSVNNNINNLNIININNKFNILQSKLLNLDYDYYYVPINNNIQINSELIEKNYNIILNEDYIIIRKNLLKYYNFIDIYNNKLTELSYNKNVYINNEYINSKFYNIINFKEYNYEKYIYLDIYVNNLKDYFYIIKLITYLENLNYNINIKSNKYYFFENYFDENLIFDYKNISNLSEINFIDNYNISEKVKFKEIKYNKLHKFNYKLISDIFENILFLDLKKK